MIHEISNAIEALSLDGHEGLGGAAGTPSNQAILDAAKKAYGLYQSAVDASAMALANLITSGDLQDAITTLDQTNWQSSGITDSVVAPIFANQQIQSAIGSVKRPLQTFSVGCFSNALPGGTVGMTGFARSLAAKGTKGLTLQIDLYRNLVSTTVGQNLQLGQWVEEPSELHNIVYGLYLQTTVKTVVIDLKIVLDANLNPYGFVESAGAELQVPVNSSPFGGNTSIW